MSLLLGTVLVGIVIWLLIKLLFLEIPSSQAISKFKKIHGPNGLPFLGVIFDFMFMPKDGILDYMTDITNKYPRLTAMYLAGIPCVIVQKPQDIQQILGNNKNIMKGFEYRTLLPWLNDGLLTSSGIKWHTRRKLLTPTFHFKILEDALSGMNQNTKILANNLSKTEGKSVKVDDYITRCTLDIIGETAMGVRLEAQSHKGNEYVNSVKKTAELAINRVLSVYLMKDFMFALSSSGRAFKAALKVLHGFTDKVIAERKKATDLNRNTQQDAYGCKPRKAFLDSLLDMQATNPESFTDMDIREEVDTFMFEGHDTTSTALCFVIWLLGSHPEVQEKLYDEIVETLGDGEINMKDVNKLNYLERIIKETLRLYPSVPYISRKLSSDVTLDGGVILPASSNVIILPYLLHRDPEFFPDPERFNPDRFTEEASKDRHPFAYIPFSAGPRNCIGQKFAMLEMKVTLASVVRKVKIESITKTGDFKVHPQLIIRSTIPLQCKFIPR